MSTTPSPEANAAPLDDLDQMIKVGLRLGQLLERHVEAVVRVAELYAQTDPADPLPLPPVLPLSPLPNYPADVGLTYSRLARAMRLTRALQVRLARAPSRPFALKPFDTDATANVREAVLRAVSRAAPLTDPDGDLIEPPDGVERLDHEAWEHLEDEDTDAEILRRPVAEILAVIRGDLGTSNIPSHPTHPQKSPWPGKSRPPKNTAFSEGESALAASPMRQGAVRLATCKADRREQRRQSELPCGKKVFATEGRALALPRYWEPPP